MKEINPLIFFIVLCFSSCSPEEPPVTWNRYTEHNIHYFEHGEMYITIKCVSPTGPDCATVAASVLTNAYRESFNTLKTYYYNNDVPGFIVNEDWRALLPNLDEEVAEKLVSGEYTLKLWHPSEDEATIIVQKVSGNDYSPDNVAYAFTTVPG